jgi:uncharacterized protein (DUF302 family)
MRVSKPLLNGLLVALTLALAPISPQVAASQAATKAGYAVYESQAPFDDVMEALKLAIEERGMYINNIMHMGEMLERTGRDLGMDAPIYGRAESIEFCSAVLSREMTSEDPARIVNCPFIISVYTLPGREGTTFIAHRQIPQDQVAESPVMAKVAAMLKALGDAAAAW